MAHHPKPIRLSSKPPGHTPVDDQDEPTFLQHFHVFQKLPTELRLMIWEMAVNDPHLILTCDYIGECLAPSMKANCGNLPTRCKHKNTFPGILLACWESRSVTLSSFLNENGNTVRFAHDDVYIGAFNPRCDVLFIYDNLNSTILNEVLKALDNPKNIWFPFAVSGVQQVQELFDIWDFMSRQRSVALRTHIENQWCWLRSLFREAGVEVEELESCTMVVPQDQRWHHATRGNGLLPLVYNEETSRTSTRRALLLLRWT